MLSRAGRSPTFQDPGTPLDGLVGTRVAMSPIEQALNFKTRALESPTKWAPTRESHVRLAGIQVHGYPFQL